MTTAPRRNRPWEWLLLVGAVVVTLVFAAKRFVEGTTAGWDFHDFFLPAARAILEGQSPYTVRGYVHTPLTALVVAALDLLPGSPLVPWVTIQVASGLVGSFLIVARVTAGLSLWQRSLVGAGAGLTLWASRPMVRILWLGQNDLLLLLGLGATVWLLPTRRRFTTGALLALGAAVKMWPVLWCLVILNRAITARRRLFLGVVAVGALVVVLTLPFGGLLGPLRMVEAALSYSNQGITSYSAFGMGEALFSDASPYVQSLVTSSALMWASTAVALAVVIALGWLTLRRVADRVAALLCWAPLTLLVLPVSHLWYLVLVLPLAWLWVARLVAQPRRARYWIVSAIAGVMWVTCCFWAPPAVGMVDDAPVISAAAYLVQFGALLAHATTSVVVAVLDGREDTPSPGQLPLMTADAPVEHTCPC